MGRSPQGSSSGLTLDRHGVIISTREGDLLASRAAPLSKGLFVELVAWQVPTPVRGSIHTFKYRLALVADGECVLRYDNEAGKGDHRHFGNDELSYSFTSAPQLLTDFWADVDRWRFKHADRNS